MDNPSTCLKVAACICGKDGVISELEEKTLCEAFQSKFPNFSVKQFDDVLTELFDSDDQIEDYLSLIEDTELRQFTLALARESASADGLDIRENIALKKACQFWGEDIDA